MFIPPDSLHSATLAEFGLFNTAFHNAVIGMALVAPDGRWLRVNRALCSIVGYSERELLATNFQAITHPADLDADMEHLRDLLTGKMDSFQAEKRYFHKEGKIIWILLSVSLVRDSGNLPLFFITQIQDITARRDAEDELRRVNYELQKTLAEINQLRGIVPICSYCRKVRDDSNYWHQIERYVAERSGAQFSHGICPSCLEHVERELGTS